MPSVGNVQLLALLLRGANKELQQQQSWALGMTPMFPSEHLPVHMLTTSPSPLTGACTLHPDPLLSGCPPPPAAVLSGNGPCPSQGRPETDGCRMQDTFQFETTLKGHLAPEPPLDLVKLIVGERLPMTPSTLLHRCLWRAPQKPLPVTLGSPLQGPSPSLLVVFASPTTATHLTSQKTSF